MAIKKDITVTVENKKSIMSDDVWIYQGDKNIDIYFTIVDTRFEFSTITPQRYSFTIRKPDGNLLPPTAIKSFVDSKAKLTITEAMADELNEVGMYDILIHLYDDLDSKISIPEISFEVKQPLVNTNVFTNSGLVQNAILDSIDNPLLRLDNNGRYIKTVWSNGDVITKENLNKIENQLSDTSSQLAQKAVKVLMGADNTTNKYIKILDVNITEQYGYSNLIIELADGQSGNDTGHRSCKLSFICKMQETINGTNLPYISLSSYDNYNFYNEDICAIVEQNINGNIVVGLYGKYTRVHQKLTYSVVSLFNSVGCTVNLLENGNLLTSLPIGEIYSPKRNEIIVNPLMYNIKGDGITDDSIAFQVLLNSISKTGIKKIILPKKKYIFKSMINIDVDNLEIDFQGSELIWDGVIQGGVWQQNIREYGMFNIKGTLDKTTETVVTNIIKHTYDKNFIISVVDASKYKIGDFIRIDLNCGHYDMNDSAYLYPELNQLCQILGKSGNELYINITNDYNYNVKKNGTWYNTGCYLDGELFYPVSGSNSLSINAKIWKVTPVKNFTIKNFVFEDKQKFIEGVTDVGSCVCCISTIYTYNLRIENVKGKYMKFPLVLNRLTQNSNFINIHGSDSDFITAGRGYVIQSVHCNNITYDTITGSNVRHTADFSGVLNGKMINCHDYNNIRDNSGIAIHGMCEYDITLINCSANRISLGHGLSAFPCMMDRFSVINCKFDIEGNNNYFATNFNFDNCKISTTNNLISFGNTIFNNCDINSNVKHLKIYWDMKRRGYTRDLNLKFQECRINYAKQTRVHFAWQNNLIFENCDIYLPSYTNIDGVCSITFKGSNIYHNASNLWINGTEFNTLDNPKDKFIIFNYIDNNVFKINDVQNIQRVGFAKIPNCTVISNIQNNVLKCDKENVLGSVDSLCLGLISHGLDIGVDGIISDYTDATVISKFNNNIMTSNNIEGVAHYAIENKAYTLTKMVKDNIIKNATTFDICDTTNNIKY